MQTVLRCHMAAFEAIGGVPNEILYDRMKTAVIGEAGGSVVYNRALLDFARHYGFQPKACRPYRAGPCSTMLPRRKLCPAGNNAKEWWITILLRKIAVAESINGTDRTAARINNDRGDVRKTTCRTSTTETRAKACGRCEICAVIAMQPNKL